MKEERQESNQEKITKAKNEYVLSLISICEIYILLWSI